MGSEFLSRSYFDPQGGFEAAKFQPFGDVGIECFRRTEPAPEAPKPEAKPDPFHGFARLPGPHSKPPWSPATVCRFCQGHGTVWEFGVGCNEKGVNVATCPDCGGDGRGR